MNILILVIEVILSYIFILLLYKKYKEEGIYVSMIISIIISSIMTIKTIEIMGIDIPLGLGLGTSIYIANNILIQKKGTEYLNNVFKLISISSIMFIILIMISSKFTSEFNDVYNLVFTSNIKNMVANISSIIIALYINNIIYYQLRKIKNKIWISNVLSSCIFNFVEVLIFSIISYDYIDTLYIIMMSIVIKYIIKLIISIVGTGVIYIANDYK